ncbi:hypothetical protein PISMIDRAFT_687799 [Pisolithus microcarpus 441]|uniref:Uncharacterized protein n=1 Tax=Pisolithus microcarpus 441 TaxID=765257 RepID=A0A0C9Z3L0_9AGAM|nr:hypothetical protein BKA83DRAFT_687799 [Pisolithus microcarpus]KIK14613.1 hypothetical protein PISMIDRAFT_687799 [Pisolithus microcarpus 441]
MYDAGANTLKYQLWLDARAREQVKWPCTDRGTSTIDDQGTTPSTSHQSPSSSIIHTTSVSVLPQTSTQKGKLSESHVLKELHARTTSCAVLAYHWGVGVTCKEMIGLIKMEERKRNDVRKRYGFPNVVSRTVTEP